jgi:hypothetical protein
LKTKLNFQKGLIPTGREFLSTAVTLRTSRTMKAMERSIAARRTAKRGEIRTISLIGRSSGKLG